MPFDRGRGHFPWRHASVRCNPEPKATQGLPGIVSKLLKVGSGLGLQPPSFRSRLTIPKRVPGRAGRIRIQSYWWRGTGPIVAQRSLRLAADVGQFVAVAESDDRSPECVPRRCWPKLACGTLGNPVDPHGVSPRSASRGTRDISLGSRQRAPPEPATDVDHDSLCKTSRRPTLSYIGFAPTPRLD